jgi:signal transduction histidine kinase
LEKNNAIQSFLLKLVWAYKILCFVLTFVIMTLGEKENAGNDRYSFWFLMYLGTGIVMFLIFRRNLRIILGLNIIDYFAVLMFQYFEPFSIFLELLWLPGILAAAALIVPFPWSILLPLFLGIPGCVFLSYGYYAAVLVSVGERSYPYYLASLFFYVPVTVLAIMIGGLSSYTSKLRGRTRSLEHFNLQLDKINRDITSKMFRLQNDTTLEERKRISKEIHDTAGYVFINLIMMLQAASAILRKDIEKAEQLINDARNYAERGINEIRHILQNIRDYSPAVLSLQNELFDIGKSFEKATGTALSIDYGDWPKTFSTKLDSFFMSFMEEALTNALKHGHATEISVMCRNNASHITMSVSDNGKGVNMPLKKGIGISAMEEFAAQQNGSIIIQGNDTGFKITAAIPLASIDGTRPQ